MRYRSNILVIIAMGGWWSAAVAAESQQASFSIGGKSYSIVLPEKTAIQNMAVPDQVTIRDLSKSQRLDRTLIISLEPNEAGSAIDRVEKLPDGKSLAYQTADDIGGGSGGPIAELKGRINVGDSQLFITCTDQDEWTRDPRWCVPLLESLKQAPGP